MMLSSKNITVFWKLWKICFNTLQNIFDVSLNNQAGFYSIYMKLFWIDLVIYTSILGITLAHPPQIMPIFLCVRHDKLCKNDPCLSLADVRPKKKQSENEGHDDQRLFWCIKAGSTIYINWRRSWHRARK